jgi:FkbM family methyltransferase
VERRAGRASDVRLARMLHRAGRRVGLSISRYPPPNSLERLLTHLFRRLDINCVLDVGAHVGGYVRFLRKDLGFDGHVASFEPARGSYRIMEATWGMDERWLGFPHALGRQRGTAELNLFSGGNWNSFLPPNRYGAGRFLELSSRTGSETVEVHRLADVFPTATEPVSEPRAFLKVDTQGYDLDVIEGGEEILTRILGIQMELSAKPIYEGQPPLLTAVSRLGELGFDLAGMFPISRDRDELRVIELDAVFCRGSASEASM